MKRRHVLAFPLITLPLFALASDPVEQIRTELAKLRTAAEADAYFMKKAKDGVVQNYVVKQLDGGRFDVAFQLPNTDVWYYWAKK